MTTTPNYFCKMRCFYSYSDLEIVFGYELKIIYRTKLYAGYFMTWVSMTEQMHASLTSLSTMPRIRWSAGYHDFVLLAGSYGMQSGISAPLVDKPAAPVPKHVVKPEPKVPETQPKPVPKIPQPVPKQPQPAPKIPQPVPKQPQPAPKIPQPVPKQPQPAPKPVPKLDCLIQLLKRDQNVDYFLSFLQQVDKVLIINTQNAAQLANEVSLVMFNFLQNIIENVVKILDDIPLIGDLINDVPLTQDVQDLECSVLNHYLTQIANILTVVADVTGGITQIIAGL
ncbi:unnamed protein product [Ranitomeya imitator]|uniref:Uncharacterized protein n=1 Tax=Ranitomeya imitator TaxID=111125 RepID=A0ABN9M747_9NEOB|nr:unnamed protein product [Ranitomeya imitator]